MSPRNLKRLLALEHDRLQEALDYDPETGEFKWLKQLSPRGLVGTRAGHIGSRGYRKIGIDGHSYFAHLLAWFYFYGEWPEQEIDFKNLDKDDARISNLRLATRAENARNQRRKATNTTGYKGVARFYNPANRARYRAQIRVDGKRIFLGLFHTPEEAYAAYCKKAKELHGEFARVR